MILMPTSVNSLGFKRIQTNPRFKLEHACLVNSFNEWSPPIKIIPNASLEVC